MVCRSNWSFLTYPKFYSSGTIWIIFPKIKLSLNHLFSYIQGFLSTWNKNISFEALQFFFFFNLPWRKTCKIWWKKIVRMKRRGKKKHNPLRSQSADLLYFRKKETTILEPDVDTVSVIEDGKSLVEPLQLQRGIDGS